jgi:hypothetical protein
MSTNLNYDNTTTAAGGYPPAADATVPASHHHHAGREGLVGAAVAGEGAHLANRRTFVPATF